MQPTAIAFGGHGNNLLTRGKKPHEGESRLPDLRALSLRYRRAHDILSKADYVLGTHFNVTLWEALLSKEWDTDTRQYQPLKMAIDLAFTAALEDELNLKLPQVARFAVGLSLGEPTALAAADTWHDVEVPIQLVRRRGELILAHQPSGFRLNTWALIKCGWEKAVAAVQELRHRRHSETLALTNDNATEIVLVAGEEQELEALVAQLTESGVRVRANKDLGLGAVFHHPSLKGAAHPFLEAVYESGPVASTVPVLSNVTCKPHDLEHLAFALGEHLYRPVRFTECVEYLKNEQGIERIITIGSGAIVTLLQPVFGKENVIVFDTLASVQNARATLGYV